jgi:hypothetical protein
VVGKCRIREISQVYCPRFLFRILGVGGNGFRLDKYHPQTKRASLIGDLVIGKTEGTVTSGHGKEGKTLVVFLILSYT